MMQGFSKQWRAIPLMAIGMLTLACSESGTEPDEVVNPALAEEINNGSLAPSTDGRLQQGSAPFTGPGGVPMDGAAFEFVQQATFEDGVVWKTSGINVSAVSKQVTAGAPVDRVTFGAALTGSLSSVQPGTYEISGEWPAINFVDEIFVAHATVKEASADVRAPRPRGHDGSITITDVDYFDDVYQCPERARPDSWTLLRCDYKLGIIRGTIEYKVTLSDGTEIEQERTSFTLPIKREVIHVRFNFPNRR